MSPELIAALLKGVSIITQVIQVGIQAGQSFEQLKAAYDRLKTLMQGSPLTEAEEEAFWARHAELYASWSRPLGPRPDDAA